MERLDLPVPDRLHRPSPAQAMIPTNPPPTSTGFPLKWLALAVLAIVAAFLFQNLPIRERLADALDWIRGLGHWGPILFIALYIAATVSLIPGSALTLGAGAMFGVVWGSVYVSIASTLGATAAFLAGRYLARDPVTRRIAGHARFSAVDRAVADEGWKIVLLTRLSPVFPFTLLNYAFGITRVKLGHYILASWIGMMPGTVMYVYVGSLAQAAAGERSRTAGEWTLYGVGLLATVAVTVVITRIARRTLAERIPPPEGPSSPA